MHEHSYSSVGIVLGRRNFGEADRILSVYSINRGRISLLAKGIRRPKSRKRGHVEIFSLVRFQASSGRWLDLITEVEIADDFNDVRKSLAKVSLAYYFCEVVGKITRENEQNYELYYLLLNSLISLKNGKGLKKIRFNFIQKLLEITGYWPKGQKIPDPDKVLEEATERKINSERVGKIMLK